MIKLYSTNCPKCRVIEQKLKQKGVEFEIITDNSEIMRVAKDNGINSAPILIDNDNKVYGFTEANRLIMGW